MDKRGRLPSLAELAATSAFTQVTVTRYGTTATIQAAAVTCLRHSVFGTRPVTVVLIRDRAKASYDLALVTTDDAASASAAAVTERYAGRWSVEVAVEDSKQVHGQPCRTAGSGMYRHRLTPVQGAGSGGQVLTAYLY
jgi:hypothetical protein